MAAFLLARKSTRSPLNHFERRPTTTKDNRQLPTEKAQSRLVCCSVMVCGRAVCPWRVIVIQMTATSSNRRQQQKRKPTEKRIVQPNGRAKEWRRQEHTPTSTETETETEIDTRNRLLDPRTLIYVLTDFPLSSGRSHCSTGNRGPAERQNKWRRTFQSERGKNNRHSKAADPVD